MARGLLNKLLLREWRQKRRVAKDLRVKLYQISELPTCSAFISLELAINADGEQYSVQIHAATLGAWLETNVLNTLDTEHPKHILASALHDWLLTSAQAVTAPTVLPVWLQTMLTRYIDTFPTDQTKDSLRCPKCDTQAFAYCMAREFYIKAPSSEWYRDDYFCECGHCFHSSTGGFHISICH